MSLHFSMAVKSWHWNDGGIRRLKTSKMKFMRCRVGFCLLDHRRNEHILGLKVGPVTKKLAQYK